MLELLKTLKQNIEFNGDQQTCDITNGVNGQCISCWAKFIRSYNFATYAAETGVPRSVYMLYPENKGFVTKKTGYLYGQEPKEGYMLEYNFRSKILALVLYDTMMLDYDTEKEGLISEDIIKYIKRVVDYAKTIGVNLAFVYFRTDRGLHLFLVSHKYDRNIYWVDFMNQLCNDAWYTAFSYIRGFGIRLSKKPEHKEDIVAEIGMNSSGPEYIETNLDEYPKITFKSKYLNKDLELRYFTNKYPLIGDINHVLRDQLINVRFHYLLVQYCRNLTLKDIDRLECEIYDFELDLNKQPIENLKYDMRQLRQLALEFSG